jgi:hypothetical protein
MYALWSRNKYNPLVKACSRFGFCHNFDWRCSAAPGIVEAERFAPNAQK